MKQILLLLLIAPQLIFAENIHLSEPEAWVKNTQVSGNFLTPFGTEFSASTLLLDRQVIHKDQKKATYIRFINGVNNENGLKDVGKIEIDFQPEFEKLFVHEVLIYRNGKPTNILDSHQFEIIRQERDLNNQLYSGTKTALLIIEDLQVGDYLDVSYTIEGENPIFNNRFFKQFQMSWGIPVKLANLIVNVDLEKEINIKNHNHNQEFKKQVNNGLKTFSWELHNVKEVDYQDQVPFWYIPFSLVEISEFNNWESVSQWAEDVFNVSFESNAELNGLIKKWSELPSQMEQASAATQFVQNHIRYFGIEIGINSHKPKAPLDTFKNKFGDCKDKTMLLHYILSQLNIESTPFLVSTKNREGIEQFLPSPGVFNHVILKVNSNNKTYWIDPTISNQGNTITHIGEANYGMGLPVKANSTLESMKYAHPETELKDVFEHFTIKDQSITDMTSESKFQGFYAEELRSILKTRSINELSSDFESYISKIYGFAKLQNELSFNDNLVENLISQQEDYEISDMWNESGKHMYSDFYAWNLSNHIKIPSRVVRDTPLAVHYPMNLNHKIIIKGSEESLPKSSIDNIVVNSDFLNFSRTISNESNGINVSFKLSTKKNFVPKNKVNQHIKDLKKINDALSFRVFLSLAYEEKIKQKEDQLKNMLNEMLKKRKENKE